VCKPKEGTKASHETRKKTRGRGGEIGGQNKKTKGKKQ
jgi:hypothetical protein